VVLSPEEELVMAAEGWEVQVTTFDASWVKTPFDGMLMLPF
jgi:hypothetical protein